MPSDRDIPIPLPFPVLGIDRGCPAGEQPPGTTSNLLNVRPLNANDRMGGGKRGGSKKAFAEQLGDATDGRRINRMHIVRLAQAVFGCVPRAWSGLGAGVNNAVHRISGHTPSTMLHAVGAFTSAGGATADRHAYFSTLPNNTAGAWTSPADAFDVSMNQPCGLLSHTDGYLYCAGGYDSTGPLNHFTRWDGAAWNDLGFGNTSVTYVAGVAAFSGSLYVLGSFTEAGGTTVANIARWTGVSGAYAVAGTGCNGPTLFACTHNGKLFVGGNFTSAGGTTRNYLAAWNGSAWSTVATNDLNGQVRALYSWNGNLYIGGLFTSAGGSTRNTYICRLNTAETAFEPLCYGLQSRDADATDGGVYSIDVYNDGDGEKLLVCGKFHRASNNAGGVACANIAMWTGMEWIAPRRAVNKIIYDGKGIGSSLRKKIVIAGTFTLKDIVPTPGLGCWNGSSWESVGGAGLRYGFNNVDGTTASSSDSSAEGRYKAALAAGVLVNSGGVERMICGSLYTGGTNESNVHGFGPAQVDNAIAEWDGQNWLPMVSGLAGTGAHPRCAVLHNDGEGVKAFIGGYFTSAGGVTGSPNAMMWNGEAWEAMGSGVSSGANPVNCAVSVKTTANRGLFVGGPFALMGGVAGTKHFAKWSGETGWEAVVGSFSGVSGGSADILCMAAHKDQAGVTRLFVGGNFTSVNGVAGFTNLFSIDISGATLGAITDPFSTNGGITKGASATAARVTAMAVYGDDLYIAGDFDSVDATGTPVTASNIAVYKGADNSWTFVGNTAGNNGTNARVNALMAMAGPGGGVLVAMGNFTKAGANLRRGIATWDGDKWDKLDSTPAGGLGMGDFASGLSANDRGDVQAGCMYGGRLVVTGNFYHAEGRDGFPYLLQAKCGSQYDYSNGSDPGSGVEWTGGGGGGTNAPPGTRPPTGGNGTQGTHGNNNTGTKDPPGCPPGGECEPPPARMGNFSELDHTGNAMEGTIDGAGVTTIKGSTVTAEDITGSRP